jgi:class 3 adenylate cyclase
VRLSDEQRREAVALLADLLLEAARKRAGVSGGASDGVIGGASGVVAEFPDRRGEARRCA